MEKFNVNFYTSGFSPRLLSLKPSNKFQGCISEETFSLRNPSAGEFKPQSCPVSILLGSKSPVCLICAYFCGNVKSHITVCLLTILTVIIKCIIHGNGKAKQKLFSMTLLGYVLCKFQCKSFKMQYF